jgi:hypothetical protein
VKPYRDLSLEQKKRRIARAVKWKADNPEKALRSSIRSSRRRNGVDPDAAEAALSEHDKTCGCCGTDKPGGRFSWNVDHDHATGRIRGVLCQNCNTAIGKLGDTLEGVLRAVRYLERKQTP